MINYIKNGDYYLPDLKLKEQPQYNLNKYGLLKLDYLKKENRTFYTELLMKDELNYYLFSVGNEAQNMVDELVKSYVKNDKELTEKMKGDNQMEWVKRMNCYKNMAEEIVLKELIYN